MAQIEHFTGWIKPGEYGKHIDSDGLETYWIYSWFVRWFVLRPIKFIQKLLWFCGIAVHDPIFGECTPDFNCCCSNIGRKSFIHIADFFPIT